MTHIRSTHRMHARLVLAAFLAAAAIGGTARGAVFAVTNTADIGAGSLRMAMTAANITPGRDTIIFPIPGTGPQIIGVLSQLPVLTDMAGVLIDGFTQPGAMQGANPPFTAVITVVLDGINAGMAHGIYIAGPNNIIRGLCIMRFQQDGIRIEATVAGTFANRVEACFIGTDPVGGTAQGNGTNRQRPWAGVNILADPMILGQAYFNHVWRSLISGNYAIGVSISSCPPADVFDNTVDSNLIGTNVLGMGRLGNLADGVYIGEGAHHNHVTRNVISANDTDGVCIVGYTDNAVSWFTHHNDVRDNLIGLAADGVTPLANGRDGVIIGIYGAVWQLGFAPDNTVATNHIAYNRRYGVSVWEHPKTAVNTDNNTISKNSMYLNGMLGIDLSLNGVTPNDVGDLDAGPNQELNCPVIAAAVTGPADTVRGTLSINTNPQQATVEIFRAVPCPAGSGQGRFYLGSATPDAAGNWTAVLFGLLSAGDTVTATATDATGNTSEFSANVRVNPPSNPPQISAPASLQFDTVLVGLSADRTLVIVNTGGSPLAISGVAVGAGPFSILSSPSAPIPAGGADSCRLRFTPAAAGTVAAVLTVTSNAANAPTFNISLQGTGTTTAPAILPDQALIIFGTLAPGDTSTRVLRVANVGTAPLTLLAQWIGGVDSLEFAITRACATTIPAGARDSMDVAFLPTAVGGKNAAIFLRSNDPLNPLIAVPLQGTCSSSFPVIALQPAAADFGIQVPGGSTERRILVLNTGGAPLAITGQAIGGADTAQFRIARAVPPVIPPGGRDTLVLRFAPSAAGSYTAVAGIASSDPNTPLAGIPLSGECRDSMGVIEATPASLDFGWVRRGDTLARALTIANRGNGRLIIAGAQINGDASYRLLSTPADTIPANGSVQWTLRFTPFTLGSKTAALVIESDDPNRRFLTVPLAGASTDSLRRIALLPDTVAFGPLLPGDAQQRILVVRNTGNAWLTLGARRIGGADSALFAIVRPGGGSLAPGASDTIALRYAPVAAGAAAAVLRVASNDPNRPEAEAALRGRCATTLPRIAVAPALIDFGGVQIGLFRDDSVRVSNTGTDTLRLAARRITGVNASHFMILRAGGWTLAPGASEQVGLRYQPPAVGSSAASLDIDSDDPVRPTVSVELRGRGIGQQQPCLTLGMGTLLDFGVTGVGSPVDRRVTVANTCISPVQVLSQTVTGTDSAHFAVLRPCASILQPGVTDSIVLRFLATGAGTRSAALRLQCNDTLRPVLQLALAAIALGQPAPRIEVRPAMIDFGRVAPGSARDTAVLVKNTGGALLAISGQSITGLDAGAFSILQPAGAAVPPGDSTRLVLRHAPATLGAKSATLRIASNDTARPTVDVPLESTVVGLQPSVEAPHRFSLGAPWPNPARGEVRIDVDLPHRGLLHLRVCDLLGRCVRTLHDGPAGAGRGSHAWDGRDASGTALPQGAYIVTAEFDGGGRVSRQVVLLR